jgi:holo-[acyl-carrier protein] synthase
MRQGIDIERIKRFILSRSSPFLSGNFTTAELAYAFSHSGPAAHLCGFFCAKEAYRKASGKPILFRDIEVRHTTAGAPYLAVKGRRQRCLVSISHADAYAVASVIIP